MDDPEEVSAMVLGKLKADAEMRLEKGLKKPSSPSRPYFDDSQRQADQKRRRDSRIQGKENTE
jgi:molecular chaperone DnaK (HSP70)